MKSLRARLSIPVLGLCLALSLPSLGKQVEGVDMPDTLPAADKTLKLNGAGMRIKKRTVLLTLKLMTRRSSGQCSLPPPRM